jgi:carboxyl-terminal processing protease
MKRFALGAAAAAIAWLAFLSPPGNTQTTGTPPASDASDTYQQLNLFGQVFEKVRSDYVEEVSDETLVETAINGMLSSLDPHSSYLNTEDYKSLQAQTTGKFGGLGIEVTMENGLVKVVSPIDDTPAAKAGIKPNDFITNVDGEPVVGLTVSQAVEKMRGPIDSEIKLTIQREGKDPFDVTLRRAEIRVQSVKSHLEGNNVGYIRITSFDEQTDSGLQSAVKSLKDKAGNKLVGYVIDLRNNPGGLLDQAIAVSRAFIERGEIVSTRGRNPDDAQRYDAGSPDIADGLPIVVLINGGSASASEIVAGALQDHHRAVLLGTRSFGKGSVQTIIPLPGHGAMRLTTARYYTPSGRSIQAKGIEPDILVDPAKIEKVAVGAAVHEADLRGALKNTDKVPAVAGSTEAAPANVPPGTTPAAPAETGSVEPLVLGTAEDYQLARALDLLRGVALFSARRKDSELNRAAVVP